MAAPQLSVTVVANLTELRQRLANDLGPIIATTQTTLTRMSHAFDGASIISQAGAAVKAVGDIGGASKLTAGEQQKLNGILDEAIQKYKALGTQAPPEMMALEQATRKASESSGALGGAANELVSSIGSLIGPLSIGGAVVAVAGFAKEAIDAAGHIVDLSHQTGLSTDAIQHYGYVAENTGTSVDAFTNAIFKMGVNLETGGLQVEHGMRAIGASLADIQALKPEEQFDRIMRSLAAIIDPQERNRIGVELMGKSYQQVSGAVAEYADLMKQAPVASEAAIRATDDAADAVASAWANAKTVAIDAIGGIILMAKDAANAASKHLVISDVGTGLPMQAGAQLPPSSAQDAAMEALGKTLEANAAAVKAAMVTSSDAVLTYSARVKAATAEIGNLSSAQRDEINDALKLGESISEVGKNFKLSTDAQHLWTSLQKDAQAASKQSQADIKAEAEEIIKRNAALITEINTFQSWIQHGGQVTHSLEAMSKEMVTLHKSIDFSKNEIEYEKTWNLMVETSKASLDKIGQQWTLAKLTLTPPKDLEKQWDDKFKDWDAALKNVGGEFEQLSQIADGSMADVVRAIGTAVSATGMLVDSWRQMHKEGATAADKIAGSVQAVGAAAQIGSQIGGTKGGAVGGALAGAQIGSIIPGIGTAFGAAIGAGVGAMVAAFASKGRDLVQQFADTEGGFDALHQKLLAIGDDGEQLWKTLTQGVGVNNPKQAQAAIDAVNAALDQFNQTQQDLQDHFANLLDAVGDFGGKAPKAIQPMIEQLLQMQGLTKEQQQLLKDMLGDPSMDALQDAADTLGVSFDHMGQQFKEAQIDKTAFTYQHALDTLRDSGADMNGVLLDSSDKINELVDNAMDARAALPDTMKPYIEKLIEMGKLVAPDGSLVTNIDQLSFADIPDDSLDAIKTILGQIRDILQHDIPQAASYAQSALDAVHMPADVSPGPNYARVGGQWVNYGSPEAAQAAQNSQNRNANSGEIPHLAAGGLVTRPTVALIGEAGPEMVMPLSRAGAGVGAGITVVQHIHPSRGMNERELAQLAARELPRVLRQAGY